MGSLQTEEEESCAVVNEDSWEQERRTWTGNCIAIKYFFFCESLRLLVCSLLVLLFLEE